jgi:hypothetical protein
MFRCAGWMASRGVAAAHIFRDLSSPNSECVFHAQLFSFNKCRTAD